MGVRCRARFQLPEIVDSRLRGNDVSSVFAAIPAEPVPAMAGEQESTSPFRTPRTPKVPVDPQREMKLDRAPLA